MPSEEVLKAQATIQAALAARFWVPCQGCSAEPGFTISQTGKEMYCPQCGSGAGQGSGRRYPFQVRCPCDYQAWDRHECRNCWRGEEHYLDGPKLCKHCKGTNHIYAGDLDTFCEAFRVKGWKLSILTGLGDDGDSVNLSERELGGELVRLEMVGYKEGFTGMAALELAAWKTLEE